MYLYQKITFQPQSFMFKVSDLITEQIRKPVCIVFLSHMQILLPPMSGDNAFSIFWMLLTL